MRRPLLTAALLAGLVPLASAQTAPRITLDQAMADPDWIGNAVESAWWSWDGRSAYYTQKRSGATIRDTFRVPVEGGAASKVDGAERGAIDGTRAVVDPTGQRMAFRTELLIQSVAHGSAPFPITSRALWPGQRCAWAAAVGYAASVRSTRASPTSSARR